MTNFIGFLMFAALSTMIGSFCYRALVTDPACAREFGGKGLIVDSSFDLAKAKVTCRITKASEKPLSVQPWETKR